MSARARTLLKCLLGSIACGLLLIAALFALFGFVVGRVPEYRVQLQDWINERTGVSVEFRKLSARLRLYGPELIFDEAVVRTPDRTQVLATARRGSIAFDLWNSLRTGRLTAGRFSLEAPQIGLIRTRSGRIELLGQSALPERSESFAIERLPTGHFHVERAAVSFRDAITGRGPWSLSGVNFELQRDPGALQLRGDASLPQTLGGELRFSATVEGALENSAALVSSFSISGAEVDLTGWADVLPDEWPAPETGRGSLRIQGSLHGSQLTQLSASVDFANVAAAAPDWTIPLPAAAPMRQPGTEPVPGSAAVAFAEPLFEDAAGSPAGARAAKAARAWPAGAGAGAVAAAGIDSRFDAIATEASTGPVLAQKEASETVLAPGQDGGYAGTDDHAPGHAPPVVLSYERMAFDLQAHRSGEAWKLSIGALDLSTAQTSWQAHDIEAQWSHAPGGELTGSVHADHLVLENLWPLLAYLPESVPLARVRALQARGRVQDLALEFERSPGAAPSYRLEAKLDAVGFEPTLRAPGLTGIGGELRASGDGGELQLDAREFAFELPWLFREPLQVQSLQAPIVWRRGTDGWTLGSRQVQVQSEDGRGCARFEVRIPANGDSPVLDLVAQGEDLQAAATRKYIPAGKLHQKTLDWLDRAFVGGRVSRAELILRGPTRRFPFRHGEGTFLVRGQVENASLDYGPGWLPAHDIQGEVEFRNAGVQVSARAASIGRLHVHGAQARIEDLKEARLVIDASASGQLGQGLRFLANSPVAPSLGKRFAQLQGTGALQADVHLDLPIKNLEARDVAVTARLADAVVWLPGIDAPVSALSGSLSVHDTLLASAQLHGVWLGGDVELVVRPRKEGSAGEAGGGSILTARGNADAEGLRKLLRLPPTIELAGATDWQLTTRLAPTNLERNLQPVRIASDLRGLAIGLPEPLGKTPTQVRPFELSLQFEDADSMLARGSLGEVRALIRLRRNEQPDQVQREEARGAWVLDRGGLRADGHAPALPDHPGLRIEGDIERFVMDEWLALRGRDGGGKPLSDDLRAANVRIGELELGGYRFPAVRAVLQATPAGWRIDVDGPQAAGQVIVPEDFAGMQPLRAALTRLVLTKSDAAGVHAKALRDARSLPNLQVHVADLSVGSRALGTLELQASRVPQGIRFDKVEIVGTSAQGQAHGQWLVTSEGERASLTASVVSSDVAATLRSLGYSEFMEAKLGRVQADLSWPGGYSGNILEHASGSIDVEVQNGQLVNLQPGAGRVLGLFSIAALPRRLALDFSDLTDKGLAFDRVHGNFELRDGNAYTSNLLLSGPGAEIGIAGRTGLAARDYDQTAVVTGKLGASLPVAGALAGGPAVGAALLLFSQVFKEPLKGITRGYYRITGPWEDPVVQRIDASEARAEAIQE